MTPEELKQYLPTPERLWHLLLDANARVLGPQSLDSTGGDGNKNYLQGLFTGFDFVLGKLLRNEAMCDSSLIILHDLIIDEQGSSWEATLKNPRDGETFGFVALTEEGNRQRDAIIQQLNKDYASFYNFSYDPQKNIVARMPSSATQAMPILAGASIRGAISEHLQRLETLSNLKHLDDKTKLLNILQEILSLEFFHPFRDANGRTIDINLVIYYTIRNKLLPFHCNDTYTLEALAIKEIYPLVLLSQQRLREPSNYYELERHQSATVLYLQDRHGKPLEYVIQYLKAHYPELSTIPASMTLAELRTLPKKTTNVQEPTEPGQNAVNCSTKRALSALSFEKSTGFMTLLPESLGIFANASFLYLTLSCRNRAKTFMAQLLEDGKFRETLLQDPDFIPAFCALRNSSAGFQANLSCLHFILSDSLFSRTFLTILKEQPLFSEALVSHPDFAKALCALQPALAAKEKNYSGLQRLLQHEELSLFILKKLNSTSKPEFRDNLLYDPAFIQALTAPFLIKTAAGNKNSSSLESMLNHAGYSIELYLLLKRNPEFAKELFASAGFAEIENNLSAVAKKNLAKMFELCPGLDGKAVEEEQSRVENFRI